MILLSPGAVRKTISFAKDSRLMVLRSSQQICPIRLLLSSSSSSSSNSKEENDPKERNRVLNYLETWVGTNSNNNTSSVMKSNMKNNNHDCNNDNTNDAFVSKLKNTVTSSHPRSSPLTITNASYLLPTLRIERQDTPESLSSQLHSTFVSAAAASFSSTRLAPNRSISILLQNIMKDGSSSRPRWRAPIVLDLQAIMPDGSPHYQAPSSGTIQQYKQVLAHYGLQVVGISNCPKSLEEECVTQAGLPLVWGITTQTSSSNPQNNNINNLRANSSAIDVESALQLVLAKIEEEDFPDDNPNDNQKEKDEDDVLSTINRQKNTKEGKKSVISSVINDKNLENTNIVETNTWSTIDMNSESRNAKKNSDSDMNEEITPNQNILTPPPNSKIYYGSIRSGQQVSTDLPYQSLIVIGSVNSGGECIADGDIYIFGKLRGRALAGLATASSSSLSQDSSDTRIIEPSPETSQTYRIFASNFDPELVCIGGTFTTVGKVQDFGLEEAGGAAMVTVDQKTEKLIFERIVL